MKLLIIILITCSFIVSCKSTSPSSKIIEKKTNNIKNQNFKQKTLSQESNYQSAKLYSTNFEQTKRSLAKPILEKLVNKEYIDAIILLAKLEFNGDLGYVSDKKIKKHYQQINNKAPSFIKKHEEITSLIEKALTSNLLELNKLYIENLHLCEQPLLAPLNKLENNSETILNVHYFSRCLEKYSIKNSEQRFYVISQYRKILCSLNPIKNECISDGYKALSSGDISNTKLSLVALALKEIYLNNANLLHQKNTKKRQLVSPRTGKVLYKAYNIYDNNKDNALNLLIKFRNKETKLSLYDKANLDKSIANMLFSRNSEGDTDLALKYTKEALASNLLKTTVHNQLFDKLTDIYFSDNNYYEYLLFNIKYILDSQHELEVIPLDKAQKILNFLVSNQDNNINIIKSRLSKGINYDRDKIFNHFNLLLQTVGGSKYNSSCSIVVSDIKALELNNKKNNQDERLALFNLVSGFQIIMLPKNADHSVSSQFINKLNTSFSHVEDICKKNGTLSFAGALTKALLL